MEEAKFLDHLPLNKLLKGFTYKCQMVRFSILGASTIKHNDGGLISFSLPESFTTSPILFIDLDGRMCTQLLKDLHASFELKYSSFWCLHLMSHLRTNDTRPCNYDPPVRLPACYQPHHSPWLRSYADFRHLLHCLQAHTGICNLQHFL